VKNNWTAVIAHEVWIKNTKQSLLYIENNIENNHSLIFRHLKIFSRYFGKRYQKYTISALINNQLIEVQQQELTSDSGLPRQVSCRRSWTCRSFWDDTSSWRGALRCRLGLGGDRRQRAGDSHQQGGDCYRCSWRRRPQHVGSHRAPAETVAIADHTAAATDQSLVIFTITNQHLTESGQSSAVSSTCKLLQLEIHSTTVWICSVAEWSRSYTSTNIRQYWTAEPDTRSPDGKRLYNKPSVERMLLAAAAAPGDD